MSLNVTPPRCSTSRSTRNAVKEVEGDLDQIAALIAESADLKRLIAEPGLLRRRPGAGALGGVRPRRGQGLAANLAKVMAANRRLFALPGAIAAFKRLAAKQRGEVSAEVVSAEPLSDRHVADLKAALKASLGKDVTLSARVDPSLIGGLIVKVGSRMIDDFLKTKLSSLRLSMKGAG